MTERMVKFYANVDSDGAKLKINEFRKMSGVWKYGRCISNMWGIVDCIIDRQVKYVYNDTDGSIRLKYRHKKEHPSRKKQKSSGGDVPDAIKQRAPSHKRKRSENHHHHTEDGC